MNDYTYPLGLFEAVGIEIEYMIVDRSTLNVRPIADELIRAECGAFESEIERGDISWSNELVLHLIELKTNGPSADWPNLGAAFQREVAAIEAHLAPLDARLLPTAMHPWMNPQRETQRWPHEFAEVYALFDTIFDCRTHGWANVQSVHVNLPFRSDAEFAQLHAAIRFLLPILPALAASSPLQEGHRTGALDSRLDAYRRHAAIVPALTGAIIPEPIYSRRRYEELLESVYVAIAPHDANGALRHEWVNARGAIARFDRGAIEIRLLDTQENPTADVAVARVVTAVVEALTQGQFAASTTLADWPTAALVDILDECGRNAERAVIRDRAYLDAFAFPHAGAATAGDLWQHLWQQVRERIGDHASLQEPVEYILQHGTLASRILTALGDVDDRQRMHAVYLDLAKCLTHGTSFDGKFI